MRPVNASGRVRDSHEYEQANRGKKKMVEKKAKESRVLERVGGRKVIG